MRVTIKRRKSRCFPFSVTWKKGTCKYEDVFETLENALLFTKRFPIGTKIVNKA